MNGNYGCKDGCHLSRCVSHHHIYIYIYIYIIGEKKINKPSFGYYKFISAGNSIRETNLFWSSSHNGEKNIFSMDSYLYKKWGEQEDIGKKLVSNPDVMSLSGVVYTYISQKIFLTQLTKHSATKILSIN